MDKEKNGRIRNETVVIPEGNRFITKRSYKTYKLAAFSAMRARKYMAEYSKHTSSNYFQCQSPTAPETRGASCTEVRKRENEGKREKEGEKKGKEEKGGDKRKILLLRIKEELGLPPLNYDENRKSSPVKKRISVGLA